MGELIDRILTEGEPAIQELLLGETERLHLEFKTLADRSGVNITKDDRKLIAKALCGMSNAEGGLLAIGIKTTKKDGLDAATEPEPIADVSALRNRIISWLPDLLSPQHTGIAIHAVRTSSNQRAGYIFIVVPPSDVRPHMSIPEHRYFRRGSDGTRVMEHGEVRDLMLAPQQARLQFEGYFCLRMHSGMAAGFNFHLGLSKVGRVPVIAPYMKISGESAVIAPSLGAQGAQRVLQDGSLGLYTSRDIVIHVEDHLSIGEVRLIVAFSEAVRMANISDYFEYTISNRRDDLFSMDRGDYFHRRDQHHGPIKPIDFEVGFGAENAPIVRNRVKLELWEMLESMRREFLEAVMD